MENPSRDHESLSAYSAGPSVNSGAAPSATGRRNVGDSSILPSIPKSYESGNTARMRPSDGNLTFRILCHDERVGGVIGKGGAIIRILKQETGCDIKVLEAVPGIEDRLIIVSGPAVSFHYLSCFLTIQVSSISGFLFLFSKDVTRL